MILNYSLNPDLQTYLFSRFVPDIAIHREKIGNSNDALNHQVLFSSIFLDSVSFQKEIKNFAPLSV